MGLGFRILRFSVWWGNGEVVEFIYLFLFGKWHCCMCQPGHHLLPLKLCRFGAYLAKKKHFSKMTWQLIAKTNRGVIC